MAGKGCKVRVGIHDLWVAIQPPETDRLVRGSRVVCDTRVCKDKGKVIGAARYQIGKWLNRCERHRIGGEVGAFVPEVDVVEPAEDSHVLVLKSADYSELVVFNVADCFGDAVFDQVLVSRERAVNGSHQCG